MTTEETIEQYFGCVDRGAWDECAALFNDDVVVDDQLAGRFTGTDALRRGMDAIRSGARVFQVQPQHTFVTGDAGCVIWRVEAESKQGEKLTYPDHPDRPVIGASHFQLRNGKISYMRTIHDSVPFVRLMKAQP